MVSASFPAPCAARRAVSVRTRPAACTAEPPFSGSAATGPKPGSKSSPPTRRRTLPNRTAHPKTPEIERFRAGVPDYQYRDYDPKAGRWPSRDPIGEKGGANLYAFVKNDGIGWIDYLGRDPQHGSIPQLTKGQVHISPITQCQTEARSTHHLVNRPLLSNPRLPLEILHPRQVDSPRKLPKRAQ